MSEKDRPSDTSRKFEQEIVVKLYEGIIVHFLM